jgi:hypothetical protein
MITTLLLRAPQGCLRLIAPDGREICANEAGDFDITAYPELAAQYPTWKLRKIEE